MGDGHINTIPETETISVETLVSNPSEFDDFSLGECNLFDIDDSYYEKSTSRLAHLASISPEIIEVCVDDDDTDNDDEEADVTSFSDDSILRGIESGRDSGEDTTSIDDLPLDDSMILSEYESVSLKIMSRTMEVRS
ncbi:hypothetical protein Tco_0176299 [Tanacetum coccineum]